MAYSHSKHWLRRTTISLLQVICMVKDLRRLEQPAAHGGPSLAGRGAAPGRDPGPSSAGDQRPSAVNPGERRGVRRWPNCATSGCPCPRRRRFTSLDLGVRHNAELNVGDLTGLGHAERFAVLYQFSETKCFNVSFIV